MADSSSAHDNGPDPIELTSNIGTWVAAGLAIIALVGIVGPLLAIQASMSDKNRAMNAIQDQRQKYVSRGFRLSRGLRIFRSIRVPNLSPGYIANEPDTAPLIPPLRAALARWALKPRDYLPWNTGWAKLSELIEAYEVRDGTSNAPVELGVPKVGGTLEIVNSRTALVVNKHWILLLGLLGRYGERIDKGVLQKTGIRRNIDGERAAIDHFNLPRKRRTYKAKPEKDAISEPGWTSGRNRYDSPSLQTRRDYPSSESEPLSSGLDSGSDYEGTVLAVRRGTYGTITLERSPQPTVYGITGVMQGLGRHKGSWSYLTSISFVPHTAREIFSPGVKERCESSSMQTLFWLAHGFLPCGRTPEGRQRVISLESPEPQFDALVHLADGSDWPAYSLQESDNIPISIGTAMQCLGIPEPKVLQFLPVDTVTVEKQIPGAVNGKPRNGGAETISPARSITSEDEEIEDADKTHSRSRFTRLRLSDSWVYCSGPSQDYLCVLQRDDLERLLRLTLTIDWGDWGLLLWKDKFWISILKNTLHILKGIELGRSVLAKSSGLATHSRIFRWQHRHKFYPQKLADHIALDKFLTAYFEKVGILHLRLTLGTLYILDNSLRDMTEKACSRLCAIDQEENDLGVEKLKEQALDLQKMLDEVEQKYWDTKELHEGDAAPQQPPILDSDGKPQDAAPAYTRISRKQLNPEKTLELFKIDYESDYVRLLRLAWGMRLIGSSSHDHTS